ncbi:VIT1/CCC1 transporter family protein [Dellaglioa algida]|uniref:VIT1/CCC1 transporter family protein n=1 Tax=Dellaglioa algida TaxID=105612 RepID=UPI0024C4968D|nr:VIT family protein [Dellaglioa algida]MDK1728513.1 VIT family protein [Dellaglioa algida]MDK1736083.1 VIT family protein [Dellaglioa algida]MDK1737878.1 VIT family protein [Dellaglioa algida]
MTDRKKISLGAELNILRAGVLGSNDGILTVAGVVFGVAAATSSPFAVFIAGISDLLAVAFSMASGEYVSVSTQKDTEKAAVETQKHRLIEEPEEERQMVIAAYLEKGVSKSLAIKAADNIMENNALEGTVKERYGIEIGDYVNPWDAVFSSMLAASLGGVFPLLSMTFLPENIKMWGTVVVVTFALALTGFISASLGSARKGPAILRNVIAGLVTMLVTYYIGLLFA